MDLMLHPPAPFRLRSMTAADLTAVRSIDRRSFPTPARRGLFEYELAQNDIAHYQVLTAGDDGVVGFAGCWIIGDEVHVSTIAVDPDWRGKGLGELLLLNLLHLAGRKPVTMVTLEVRTSNQTAQNLYAKYHFEVVGRRRRYYKDTGEDALIMTVQALNASYSCFVQQQAEKLFARLESALS